MLAGIIGGLLSAFLQSVSYVLSRQYINKHKTPFELVVFSQLVMGVFGALTIPLILPFTRFPLTPLFCGMLLICVIAFMAGQFGFFQTLRELEASRLSSLLGLKIIVLAIICMVITRSSLHFLQWMAIILCAVGAVGMNFTGGRIPLKAASWLGFTLLMYATCDILEAELIWRMPGQSIIVNSTAVAALMYLLLGILTIPFLLKYPWNRTKCKDAFPYAVTWYAAMILIYLCYSSLGPVYGNIIQASRGIISVLIGAWLLHLGMEHLEPRVDRKAWMRRFLMAVVMIVAMCLYSYARTLLVQQ